MGQSTAQVRRDIEDTRDEMSGTIDAIADRTSPSRVMGRQRRRVADRFRSVRTQVMGSAEHSLGETQGLVQNARESTGEMAGDLRDSAGHLVDNVRDVPDQARQTLRDQTQGNPLAVGVIAFGAGLLAAYLVPSSGPERRVARQVREQAEPVLAELTDAGREVADDLTAHAQQAADDIKQTATESARQVADDAKDKAQAVRDDATTS